MVNSWQIDKARLFRDACLFIILAGLVNRPPDLPVPPDAPVVLQSLCPAPQMLEVQ
jgi:hypothetical protein